MRSFVYKGKVYRSMAEACYKLSVSYQKVRRLCRHYVKASKDPAVALEWIMTNHNLCLEVKTWKYADDLERRLDLIRQKREQEETAILSGFLNVPQRSDTDRNNTLYSLS